MKILLAVDGSEHSVRATRKLIETLGWYKEAPRIEVLTVHLPVPHIGGMSAVVTHEMIERYYREEGETRLAAVKKELDATGAKYGTHVFVGPIAETIVDQSKKLGCDMIFMGTRGMGAVPNVLVGSIATKVLHLSEIPVTLIR